MNKKITTFLRDESGATAIEYGLIAALISVGIIAALTEFADSNKAVHDFVRTSLEDAVSGAGGG